MSTRLTRMVLAGALGMGLAFPAMAQDDTAADPEATEEVAPATDGPTLDLGEPVASGEPQVGQPYIREAFTDWGLRCIRAPEGQPDPCDLYQLLTDSDGNEVAEISIVPLPPGSEAVAGATVVAPLETLLTEQLVISVDGGEARRYPFRFCNRAGCVAQIGLTEAQINQFRRGASATMRLVPAAAPDQVVELDVSLSGFTAGFNAATEVPDAEE